MISLVDLQQLVDRSASSEVLIETLCSIRWHYPRRCVVLIWWSSLNDAVGILYTLSFISRNRQHHLDVLGNSTASKLLVAVTTYSMVPDGWRMRENVLEYSQWACTNRSSYLIRSFSPQQYDLHVTLRDVGTILRCSPRSILSENIVPNHGTTTKRMLNSIDVTVKHQN